MRWSGRLARWLIVGSVAVLAACSTMKLGYQQGNRLVYWWVDRYFDMQDAQVDATRGAITRFFAWHRREQLPRIAVLLERAQNELQQPVSAEQMRAYQAAYYALGRDAFEHAKPDIADILLTVTPAQIAHVRKQFGEANEKYQQRYLQSDADERLQARLKQVMANARLIYGRFTNAQEEVVAMLDRVQAEHPDKASVMQWLTTYADQWQHPPGERGTRHDAYLDADIDVSVTIANLTTPQQKQHARERLQGWIDDAHDLIRDGAGQTATAGRPVDAASLRQLDD
jgi:hypothetical protein